MLVRGTKTPNLGKRYRAAAEEYGRACVAMQRMKARVDAKLAELIEANRQLEATQVRYSKAAKRLAKLRGLPN